VADMLLDDEFDPYACVEQSLECVRFGKKSGEGL